MNRYVDIKKCQNTTFIKFDFQSQESFESIWKIFSFKDITLASYVFEMFWYLQFLECFFSKILPNFCQPGISENTVTSSKYFFVIHFDPPQSKPLLPRIRDVHCRGWLHGNINLLIFSEPPHTRGLSFQGDFKVNYPKFVYVGKVTIGYRRSKNWVDTVNLKENYC